MSVCSKLYKDYVKKCKTEKQDPISKKEFKEVHKAAQKNVSVIRKKYKKPMCAIELDKTFIYYVELREKEAVVNIWTRNQYKILTGG